MSRSSIHPQRLDQHTATDRSCMHLPAAFTLPALVDDIAGHDDLRATDRQGLIELLGRADVPLPRRLAAGALLGLFGDPRIRVLAPDLVTVPGTTFRMGLDPASIDEVHAAWRHVGLARGWLMKEIPAHPVTVPTFRIGRFPVTNVEYRRFLEETCTEPPASWRLGAYPWWQANHPVHGVTADNARAYAAWLNRRTSRPFRLPTEQEWELAATGGDRRAFPWGNSFSPELANTLEGGLLTTTPVGIYPDGAAPCGALDVAGNVEEWVDACYAAYPGGVVVKDDLWTEDPTYAIARGGSHTRFGDLARCRRRHGYFPRDLYVIGFRVAEDLTA